MLVVTRDQWMRRRDQRGRTSTAYEIAHRKEKADEKREKEYEEYMEESSRSVEQHVGRSGQIVYSVRECLVSQELLIWMILWWRVV